VYHPFPTDSAIWVNRLGHYNPPGIFDPYYVITIDYYDPYTYYCMNSSDTTIGSFVYSKLDSCGGPYQGALRDDNGKIYFIPADSVNELLVYDFTLNNGDPVSTYYKTSNNSFTEYTTVVGPVDSVLINGSYRKRMQIEAAYWVEGIGNTSGLFRESWPNVSNYVIDLVCMSENNTALYPSASGGACSFSLGIEETKPGLSGTIYPNPSAGNYQISVPGVSEYSVEITDVLGKTVFHSKIKNNVAELDLSDKQNGIYFVRISDSKGNSVTKKILKQ